MKDCMKRWAGETNGPFTEAEMQMVRASKSSLARGWGEASHRLLML